LKVRKEEKERFGGGKIACAEEAAPNATGRHASAASRHASTQNLRDTKRDAASARNVVARAKIWWTRECAVRAGRRRVVIQKLKGNTREDTYLE
jgi:hypothetical protein